MSKRLKLYTDVAPEIARTLPPLVDQLYDALEEYFGPLPPDREYTPFRMTGYIFADRELFERLGLLPVELPDFEHGRHRGSEFWMHDQKTDYYRRHLMLHEATHCFMLIMPGSGGPGWYLEGMAELFGTHRVAADGTVAFGVMPDNKRDFKGHGRITRVRNDVADGSVLSLAAMLDKRAVRMDDPSGYAWSWAFCTFLDAHPDYHARFKQVGTHRTPRAFSRAWKAEFADVSDRLDLEWTTFAGTLDDGYDVERAALVDLHPGDDGKGVEYELAADRGWASTGIAVEEGKTYHVRTTGRFVLAKEPKPWVSEARGVSIEYFDGRPLGLLLGAVVAPASDSHKRRDDLLSPFPLGDHESFTTTKSGTLYLRINDDWSRLTDNEGSVRVRIESEDD